MRNKSLLLRGSVGFVAIVLLGFAMDAGAAQRNKAQLKPPTVRDVRRMEALKEEVRHQLAMLPYYSVFDWLQAEVKPDDTITLSGQVVRPTLRTMQKPVSRNSKTRRASSTRLKCWPFRPWMTSCGLHCIAGFTASIPHCSGMPHGHLRRSTSS